MRLLVVVAAGAHVSAKPAVGQPAGEEEVYGLCPREAETRSRDRMRPSAAPPAS